nr:reverse transcriptase domain-containing protein [Tanacetum cinerariifolium]
MQTRSSLKFVGESSTNPTSKNPKRRNQRRSKQRVESIALEETLVVTMADQRTMAELFRAPTEGYAEAIVVPPIPAEHFELKHSLINLVTLKQFFGFKKEDPHAHIRYFNKITSTLKYKDVPETSIKLMLFPFSIDGLARIWLDKEPPRSILTWDDFVSNFINHFFPPSKTTNLRNEISNFNQKFEETFYEAWDRFKDLLRACPHHGFTELHQLDTFYNGLNPFDQDSLNSAAGGNVFERSTQDALKIIENKSRVRNSRNKPIVCQVKASNFDSSKMSKLTDALSQCPATNGKTFTSYHDNIQGYVSAAAVNNNYNQGYRSQGDPHFRASNQMGPPSFPFSGATLTGSSVSPPPSKEVDREPEMITDQVLIGSTNNVPPLVVQPSLASTSSTPISSLKILELNPHQHPIPCPSRQNKEKLQGKDDIQILSCLQMFKKLYFNISFSKALVHMPKTAHALVDVHGEKLTLRGGDEELVFNVESASKYPQKHSDKSIHKIDILDTTCDDHFHQVLNNHMSGSPTFSPDPMVESLSHSLTPFGDSDFLLEETNAFLSFDDSIPPGIDDDTYNSKGDILFLEKLLNEDPTPDLPPIPHLVCLINDAKKIKSSIDDPPDLELKDLPSYIEKRPLSPVLMEHLLIDECLLAFAMLLGHFEDGLEVDRAKVDVIAKLSPLTTVKGVRSFLGYASFYRRFIQDFSKIARPMTHLLEKDTPFIFSDECLASFKILKKMLTEAPILVSPDLDLSFELMCDASDYAVGVILGQRKDKYFRPIHYASKTLSDAQTNYTVAKKELLAVVYAFEKFWSYLVLSKTIVYIDHSTLRYLFNKQDAKPRLLWWILLLHEVSVEIHDKKRSKESRGRSFKQTRKPVSRRSAENRPPMLEKDMSDSWRSRMELYMLNRQHDRMILESIEHGPLLWPSVTEDGVTRLKKYSELSSAEATQADCDDLWERIQMLMQGTSLTKQERECKLYDAFDKFAYQKGETLRDFYLRFSLLLNDMNMYNMKLEQFQVNTKFLNTLPPKWSKFVTDVKLVRNLHTTNFDQLHAYLGQHEYHANEVRLMHERTSDPLALISQHQMNRTPYHHHQSLYHQSQFQQQATSYQSSPYATTYHNPQTPYQCHQPLYRQSQSQQQATSYQSSPYATTYHNPQFVSQGSSSPNLLISYLVHDTSSTVNHSAYMASAPQIEYAPIAYNPSEFSSPETGLVVPVFQKGDDPIDAINHMMSILTSVVASRYPGRQNFVSAGSSRPFTSVPGGAPGKQRVIVCYNCKGEGHMSKQCTKPRRKRDAEWFKDKEKVLVITALKVQLNKLKGKAILSEVVSLNPIDPELLKVDVAPLVPKLGMNRTAHTDYIRHTQEEAATLRENIERRIFTLVGNVCPLTRIATPTIVPPREPIPIVNSTDKPVVTLVVQIILWYLDFGCSKHMTGDCSQLVNFVQKFLGTVKFGNDHVVKIMGYGDYQIGNVTISRLYYVEGLGHNLFSVGQFCDSDLEVAFRQHTCFIRNLDGVDLGVFPNMSSVQGIQDQVMALASSLVTSELWCYKSSS